MYTLILMCSSPSAYIIWCVCVCVCTVCTYIITSLVMNLQVRKPFIIFFLKAALSLQVFTEDQSPSDWQAYKQLRRLSINCAFSVLATLIGVLSSFVSWVVWFKNVLLSFAVDLIFHSIIRIPIVTKNTTCK